MTTRMRYCNCEAMSLNQVPSPVCLHIIYFLKSTAKALQYFVENFANFLHELVS